MEIADNSCAWRRGEKPVGGSGVRRSAGKRQPVRDDKAQQIPRGAECRESTLGGFEE